MRTGLGVGGLEIRRLAPADSGDFHRLRLEGFALQARAFRYAPEDEAHLTASEIEARLARDFVLGAFDGEALVGIAGLSRNTGRKTAHKALLFGMYLRPDYRGRGVADALMSRLIEEARGSVEILILTVMSDNAPAVALYRRWGFESYGIEPRAVKEDGLYFDEMLMSLGLAGR
ncbi:MAG: GNAT family N-acetyltransferase [Methylocystis sp.]